MGEQAELGALLVTFLIAMIKHLKDVTERKRIHLGSQLEGIQFVILGGEDTAEGMGYSCGYNSLLTSKCTRKQKEDQSLSLRPQ